MLNCDRIRVLSSPSQFPRFVKEYLIKDEKEHIKVITSNIMDLLTLRNAKNTRFSNEEINFMLS